MAVGNATQGFFAVVRQSEMNKTERAGWPGKVWTHFGSTFKNYATASVWSICPEGRGAECEQQRAEGPATHGRAPDGPIFACRQDKPT